MARPITLKQYIALVREIIKLEWADQELERNKPILDQDALERYQEIERKTKFAPSSIGRRKPISGRLISDNQYGVDSGGTKAQWVNDSEHMRNEIARFSDREWAADLNTLMAAKSPYRGTGLLGVKNVTLGKVTNNIGDRALEIYR